MHHAPMVADLPIRWRWAVEPLAWRDGDGAALTVGAGPRTDLFVAPDGSESIVNAPRLLGRPDGGGQGGAGRDFLLSARVTVRFEGTYDAGALLLWAGDRTWAKLAFEHSPDREAMIVSVVTRGVSDDANGFVVAGDRAWLRIARIGPAYAFHASTDGVTWRLIRHFALPAATAPEVGFLAQSPLGEGCTAIFDHVSFAYRTLGDLRDGT